MKILIFNWRDRKNPRAGGAEVVTEELARRWVSWGHEVTLFTASFPGALPEETVDGVKIIRRGGQATVHWQAFRYYLKYLKGKFDIVIDEVNTIPFFTPLYVRNGEKRILYINQLCREIWFYEAPVPRPLAALGYVVEPLYLQPYRKTQALTISDSTRQDLRRLGIHEATIFPMGLDIMPLEKLSLKPEQPHFIFVGRQVPSKRVEAVIEAFYHLSATYPQTILDIVGPSGDTQYSAQLASMVENYGLKGRVLFHGKVEQAEKYRLMQEARAILVTSIREGWGLIVTEANAMGTPAIVYNVPGLRDAVRHNNTGLVTSVNKPVNLAEAMTKLLENPQVYEQLRYNAWEWSKELTWDASARKAFELLQLL